MLEGRIAGHWGFGELFESFVCDGCEVAVFVVLAILDFRICRCKG